MVESQAAELSEEIMLNAILFGHQQMQGVIQAIKELAAEAGKPAWDVKMSASELDASVEQEMIQSVETSLIEAYQVPEKFARKMRLEEIQESAIAQWLDEEKGITTKAIQVVLANLEEKIVRGRILSGEPRIDGRDKRTVRPINILVRSFTKYSWFCIIYSWRNASISRDYIRYR